jgi:hypothetical protein
VKRAVIAGTLLSLIAFGSAYGYWQTLGSGTGTATTGTASPLTLSPGTPTDQLHPGGSADVAVTVTNPNAYAVHVGRLALDTSQGTAGFAVDAGHSACGVASLSYATQSNGGDGWDAPANGSLVLRLPGALSMTAAAANACQGATFSIYLATDRDANAAVRTTPGLITYWRLGEGVSLNGSSGQVYTTTAFTNPTVYSTELWFRTATTNGGELIGFGNSATGGASCFYDRHMRPSRRPA